MSNKLVQAALYVAQQSRDDSLFSSTKLNKILFLADFYAYGVWGASITESDYIHNPYGPTIKGWRQIREEMVAEDVAEIQERQFFGYVQKRLIPKMRPNMSVFSDEEINFLDNSIEYCRNMSAKELSDWTHDMIPWLSTRQGEVIPYVSVFMLETKPPTQDEIEWAISAFGELTEEEMQPA